MNDICTPSQCESPINVSLQYLNDTIMQTEKLLQHITITLEKVLQPLGSDENPRGNCNPSTAKSQQCPLVEIINALASKLSVTNTGFDKLMVRVQL